MLHLDPLLTAEVILLNAQFVGILILKIMRSDRILLLLEEMGERTIFILDSLSIHQTAKD
jgi:hypothetical protein